MPLRRTEFIPFVFLAGAAQRRLDPGGSEHGSNKGAPDTRQGRSAARVLEWGCVNELSQVPSGLDLAFPKFVSLLQGQRETNSSA